MNQLVHRQFALVPENFGQAMDLAKMMAQSELLPKHLQGKPADCLQVLMQAVRWEMDPFAVAQETSVIQGKLMYSGKMTAAVVNARGNLSRRLSYGYDGTGDNRKVTVSGVFQGEEMPRVIEVFLKDAKTQNRVWQIQPDQQLAYFGARAWARRHAPELMLGVYSPEEFEEQSAKPAKARDPITGELSTPALLPPTPPHDPETGEIHDGPIPDFLDRRASAASPSPPSVAEEPAPSPTQESGAGDYQDEDPALTFVSSCEAFIARQTDPQALGKWWNSAEQKKARRDFELDEKQVEGLKERVIARRDALMHEGATGK